MRSTIRAYVVAVLHLLIPYGAIAGVMAWNMHMGHSRSHEALDVIAVGILMLATGTTVGILLGRRLWILATRKYVPYPLIFIISTGATSIGAVLGMIQAVRVGDGTSLGWMCSGLLLGAGAAMPGGLRDVDTAGDLVKP